MTVSKIPLTLPPPPTDPITIGVLALQGAFQEHLNALSRLRSTLSIHPIAVRTATDLARCTGLIIPGGESTAISLIASRQTDAQGWSLLEWLKVFAKDPRRATWGTCAGMVLLAEEVEEGSVKKGGQEVLGTMEGVKVVRNQWGRQTESFEVQLDIPILSSSHPFPGIFIRAPVLHTLPTEYKVLARVPRSILPTPPPGAPSLGPDADIVAYRKGRMVACSFHPELSGDVRFCEWWVKECVLVQTDI